MTEDPMTKIVCLHCEVRKTVILAVEQGMDQEQIVLALAQCLAEAIVAMGPSEYIRGVIQIKDRLPIMVGEAAQQIRALRAQGNAEEEGETCDQAAATPRRLN